MFVLLTTTRGQQVLSRHAHFDFRKGYIEEDEFVVVKESLEEIYDKIRK